MEILAILLLIGASMVISANDQTTYIPQEEQNKTVEAVEAYRHSDMMTLDSYDVMNINAQDWLEKYSNNFWKENKQMKMKDNWKGHYIKLTGEISKIRYDYISGCKISFRQKDVNKVTEGTCMIICSVYDQKDIDEVLNYKKGDTITLVGYSQWIIGPEIIDCHVR